MRTPKVISTVLMLAIVLGLSIVTSAQVEQPTNDTYISSIEGKVVDALGTQPLVGIKVHLVEAELSDSTDTYGIFNFTDLTSDSYTIKIDEEGYELYEEEITLKEGTNVVFIKLTAIEEREKI